MAMYDHRTFLWKGKWWVAEVHGGSGAGWGNERPAITRESVFFTCISDEEVQTFSADITPGDLNRLSHSAIGDVLDKAEAFGSRFDMYPYNMPDAEELQRLPQVEDDEDLRWAYRKTRTVSVEDGAPGLKDGLELLCLDDSALKGVIPFKDADTRADFLAMHGGEGVRELVKLLKSTYLERSEPG